jgi:hypothetical protein
VAGCGLAGAAAGGVSSFFLTTVRFAAVFLAFLEGFSAFFFAICLLDDTDIYAFEKERRTKEGGRAKALMAGTPTLCM